MSDRAIFDYLREGGLSIAGACAVMGNMYCESLLRSDNVEDRCTLSDAEYTDAVNTGAISSYQFAGDAYGYGLCQWTFYTRKQELWNMTVAKGISVADERTQCQLCIAELQRDYANLYSYLCSDNCAIDSATRRVCSEYERPYTNNYSARIDAACRYYNQFHDAKPPDEDPGEDQKETGLTVDGCCGVNTWAALISEMPTIEDLPIVKIGSKGWAVSLCQVMLNYFGENLKVDGDCGPLTEKGIKAFQEGKL